MKILFTFIAVFFTTYLWAAGPQTFKEAQEFTYSTQDLTQFEKSQITLLTKLDSAFADRSMSIISLPKGFEQTQTSLSTMTRIYSGEMGQTTAFVKTGVVPSREDMIGEAIKMPNGFLYHYKDENGLVTALFVQTDQWENAREIFSIFENKSLTTNHFHVPNKYKVLSLLVSSALAKDDAPCDKKALPSEPGIEKLKDVSDKLFHETSSPIQYVAGCTMSALKGVWDGSVGGTITFAKEAIKFVKAPIESGKRYWDATTKLWDVTKQFFSDFENEARGLYSSYDTLDPLVKTKLACEVAGLVGGNVLMTYLTGAVLATATMKTILAKIKDAITIAMNSKKFQETKALAAARAVEIEKNELTLKKSLFTVERGTVKESIAKNEQVLVGLKDMPTNSASKRKVGLDDAEMYSLFREVNDHPVAALSKVSQYEKFQKGIGFCFGRATTAHLAALKNGVDKDSIRKVWALGDLRTGDVNWRYHVATIVRNKKGEWIAIDPIFGRPMPVDDWYKEMKKFDHKGNMRIFDTEPKRMGPDAGGQYNKRQFNHFLYNGYFTDLMASFREESKKVMTLKEATP